MSPTTLDTAPPRAATGTRLAALMLVALMGCAPVAVREPPPPSAPEVADAQVAADVKLAYHEARLAGHEHIRVDVEGGRVTLSGRARPTTARRAVELAREVPGVRSVADATVAE